MSTTERPSTPPPGLWDPGAIPAATVIPLRDGPGGLELLMLRRDTDLTFAGGMWVFPGGRIDPEDWPGDASGEPVRDDPAVVEEAARNAALREATEESTVVLEPATVRRWSHWTPPAPREWTDSPRHRFTTAFFVGVAIGDTDDIQVDGSEIRDHRWVGPSDMLGAHSAGEVTLAPPTYITLCQLAPHRNPAEVLLAAPRTLDDVEHFATRVGAAEGGWMALYHGDVAYDDGDTTAEGPRHRLLMDGTDWHYERSED